MKVAILIADCGDGSACLRWFKNMQVAKTLAEGDDWCEEYGINDGSPEIVDVPDTFIPPGGFDDEYYECELNK